jgi:hypothetical protein
MSGRGSSWPRARRWRASGRRGRRRRGEVAVALIALVVDAQDGEQSAPELLRTRVRLLIQPLQQPCCSAGVGVVVAEDPTAAGEGVLVECEGPLVLTHRG